jgi:hypothetical protein
MATQFVQPGANAKPPLSRLPTVWTELDPSEAVHMDGLVGVNLIGVGEGRLPDSVIFGVVIDESIIDSDNILNQ